MSLSHQYLGNLLYDNKSMTDDVCFDIGKTTGHLGGTPGNSWWKCVAQFSKS